MLYILPPPAAPNPPSPWTTILCGGQGCWVATGKPPPRPPSRPHRNTDSGAGGSVDDEDASRNSRSLSECYFAGKGAALVLPPNERLRPSRRVSASGSDIQQHLQSMFYLLRPEETLKMAVKLESVHAGRTRYLVVVSCIGRQDAEESCLLGIDCRGRATVGLVLRVLADTSITLDGDGGFSVSVCGRQHIFKPVSVQAMWSALQTLHKVSSKAREQNYFLGGLTHDWVSYYEQRVESDRSCLNEWHAMDSLESRRPPSPDSVRTKPLEREETERVIRCTLKEIMMSVDLDEVTSKYIRGRLEEDLDMDLGEFKPFIDQEMLTILGQMDAATEIFDHVYLGSEWNASNLEELQKNGVHHILNVTREIDNFFPGMFNYLNIRVYDDEKTDLLKHWDNTFKYITRARKEGSKVLVHCKMGVSRSASVVIAYAMKAYNWDFKKAFEYVKQKRSCIKPNTSFVSQLETYQGILDAMKNREKLQRSKSETNLKSPGLVAKAAGGARVLGTLEPGPQGILSVPWILQSGEELGRTGGRPKSWSPEHAVSEGLLVTVTPGPTSVSLEQLPLEGDPPDKESCLQTAVPDIREEEELPVPVTTPITQDTEMTVREPEENHSCNLNVRMPCRNGQAYSVSQNKVVYLPATSLCPQQDDTPAETVVPSVKHRVNELESQSNLGNTATNKKVSLDRKGLVLNLTTQFEASSSKPGSPNSCEDETEETECQQHVLEGEDPVLSQTKPAPQMLTAVLVKKEMWDPGEKESPITCAEEDITNSPKSSSVVLNSNNLVWTSSAEMVEKNNLPDPVSIKAEPLFVSELKFLDGESGGDKTFTVLPSSLVTTGSRTLPRREGDPFSAQLDRVFDREERKQQRTVVAPPVTEEVPAPAPRECPSRQSSWSSYDSAVVLGYQGEARDAPSRQSSWGSGDTRTLPSRNSSWGSYDMRPSAPNESSGLFSCDEIPWYPGTVKRTKQKLEEGTVKRVCPDGQQRGENSPSPGRTGDGIVNVKIHGPRPYQSPSTQLAVCLDGSAPLEAHNTALIHYASSPTLCSRTVGDGCDAMSSSPPADKMAVSQPNINLMNLSLAANNEQPEVTTSLAESSSAISQNSNSDLPVNLHTSKCSLSHSATGSSTVIGVEPICSCLHLPVISSLLEEQMSVITCDTVSKNTSPCIINTPQCASVRQQRKVLENLTNTTSLLSGRFFPVDEATDATKDTMVVACRTSDSDSQKSVSGLVKNLKKEFEAKSVIKSTTTCSESCGTEAEPILEHTTKRCDTMKVRSLPSSPVTSHPDCCSPGSLSPSSTMEDLSVKMLVGKYEVGKTDSPLNSRHRLISENESLLRRGTSQPPSSSPPSCKVNIDGGAKNNAQPGTNRHSSLLVHNLKNGSTGEELRRPPVPSVVVASVVAKAASKKQQQGKTHPLARLAINKPRHNNPVYNTM